MATETVNTAIQKINNFEAQIGFPKDSLVNCMILESGLKPSALNHSGSGASGLIQIMPTTLKSWGIDPAAYRTWSIDQQLPTVAKYFNQFKSLLSGITDDFEYYCIIFYPVLVGKSDDYVVSSNPQSAIYKQNIGFAVNGKITKGSIRQRFYHEVNNFRTANGLPPADQKKNVLFDIAKFIEYIFNLLTQSLKNLINNNNFDTMPKNYNSFDPAEVSTKGIKKKPSLSASQVNAETSTKKNPKVLPTVEITAHKKHSLMPLIIVIGVLYLISKK